MDRSAHPLRPVGELEPYEAAMIRHRRHVLPLPEHDPVIESMPPALRLEVGRTWRRRAHEELNVARGFTVLCRELLETGAPPEVLAFVSRAVHDEVRHGEVCRTVASRYFGADVPWPDEIPVAPPSPEGDRHLRAAYHLVTICCVNEAVACSFLETCLSQTVSPTARAAFGDLMADEVLHARAGWIYVAHQAGPIRAAIEANLLTLVRPIVNGWWDDAPFERLEGVPEHGIPSLHETRACAVIAVRDIVLPAFEELGFAVEPTRAWIRERDAALDALAAAPPRGAISCRPA